MIDVKRLVEAYEHEGDVKIICDDGESFVGDVVSVDDEDDSGLGEIGITMFTEDGVVLGLGLSEIDEVVLL